ncbi:MAG: putative transcripton factor for heterocyst differentiation DevT [Myxococcaceae bacterium]|nr:putative transcripton factor for heterocyst differentiation DevT [Myxococcaceae bacterium]
MDGKIRLGLIGDLHGSWDDWDTRYFSASDYALLLFMGDLGSSAGENGVRIARSIGRIDKRALIMPGNNDVHLASRIAAELGHQRGLWALRKVGAALGTHPPSASSGQVHLCGYSVHAFDFGPRAISVLAARPYGTGGGELSYPERLLNNFGIDSMEASARKLRELVDQTTTDELIIIAHNGPTGLGADKTDLWGCDFREQGGDFGDPDLAECIAYASTRGKRVLAVLAGHMHSPTRGRELRRWQSTRDGTLYVNSARVPRIWEDASGKFRHHIALELDEHTVTAREVIVHETT